MLERLGPYVIDKEIGRGGMGFVYSATHQESGDRVAVKMLSNAFADDTNFRDRFQQEIETLQQLQHEGIVQILGFGQEDGILFYAMELVEGRTLFQILKESGPLSWREVIRVTISICHALKHAHDRGVIHRDLKPSNLFLTQDDQIKLVDFGIARLFGATQLTADHAVVGTADYMAPEQAEGARPTVKSDLYSLGSVMYALLTGHPPFASPSVAQVIHKLKFNQPQPVTEIVADVPMELDYIVRQLLSKKPENRIPTPLAVAHRLQAMQHALEANMPVSPSKPELEVFEGDIGATNSTVEYIATGQRGIEAGEDHGTIDGEYLSNISEFDAEHTLAESDYQDHAKASVGPSKPSHYTDVKNDRLVDEEQSSSGVVASLLVLVALLIGIGGLFAFTNWINQPRSAEELLEVISEARLTPGADWGQASKEMKEFIERFPGHDQFSAVENYYNTLRDEREERRFLDTLDDDLANMPAVKITLIQILEQEASNPGLVITKLEHFIALYKVREQDEVTVNCLTFARRKVERLQEAQAERQQQRQAILAKHRQDIIEVTEFCRTISLENRENAIGLLEAIYQIHRETPELEEVLQGVLKLQDELTE